MPSTHHVLGLMSGTSLDGLDLAYCSFSKTEEGKWSYQILSATTVAYSNDVKTKLKSLPHLAAIELLKASNWFGDLCGNEANDFLDQYSAKVDFIASHGHTVFHNPADGYTLQIGSGANIHAKTGLSVVCDFRTVDVALGGQGAPLVPVGDKLLFHEYTFCLNLGGIANISFEENDNRIAFDICPVNIVLNAFAEKFNSSLAYDANGDIARSGVVIDTLLKALNNLSFYDQPYPKSLGKEWVDATIFPLLASYSSHTIPDLLCTFCHHIAMQIASVAKAFCNRNDLSNASLLVTGGGAFNGFLLQLLQQYLGETVKIIIPDEQTISFKEALIFAFLGVLRMESENNSLASVTGASRDSIGGAVYGNLKK